MHHVGNHCTIARFHWQWNQTFSAKGYKRINCYLWTDNEGDMYWIRKLWIYPEFIKIQVNSRWQMYGYITNEWKCIHCKGYLSCLGRTVKNMNGTIYTVRYQSFYGANITAVNDSIIEKGYQAFGDTTISDVCTILVMDIIVLIKWLKLFSINEDSP